MLKRLKAALGQYFAKERILALEQCVRLFVDHEIDYMIINNLGDPLKQHNVKLALTLLEKSHKAERWTFLQDRTTVPHKMGVKAVRDHLMKHYSRKPEVRKTPPIKGTEWFS